MARKMDIPQPDPGQALVRVLACGVCRTDLHVVDGDLTIEQFCIPGALLRLRPPLRAMMFLSSMGRFAR